MRHVIRIALIVFLVACSREENKAPQKREIAATTEPAKTPRHEFPGFAMNVPLGEVSEQAGNTYEKGAAKLVWKGDDMGNVSWFPGSLATQFEGALRTKLRDKHGLEATRLELTPPQLPGYTLRAFKKGEFSYITVFECDGRTVVLQIAEISPGFDAESIVHSVTCAPKQPPT